MVPNKWIMHPVLHKSPPRSWLGIRLRLHEKPAQDEECVVCQHPDCSERRHASKVCHHPDCQELNGKSPLHLCESCDSSCHLDESDSMHFDRHLRFDVQTQGSILARNVSTRSCPPRTSPRSDLDEDEEGSTERGEHKTGGMKLKAREGKKPRRRHTDDPRKECFSLKFDLNIDIDTEIVPAVKKKTLREVLGPIFERKGIELSRVDLFLDQSNTPLSLDFEAYRFGGHYLKVKARPGDELKVEQSVKDLRSLSLPSMNPPVGGSVYILTPGSERPEHGSLPRRENVDVLGQARRRKNMTEFLGDANIRSPDTMAMLGGPLPGGAPGGSVATGPDNWKNRATSRISVFFGAGSGKEVDRVELLQTKLQAYTQFGLPKVPFQLAFHQDSWEEEEEEPNLTLEESWRELLEDPESLSRRQFQQQEAIWELIQTEASYIKRLRVITDLFQCGLLNLQDNGLLVEVEPQRLFSNIHDIVRLHSTLWVQVMLPVLEKARSTKILIDPADLQQGFSTFASRFQPYVRYCMEEESCMEYMRSLLRDNEIFKIYVTWAETNKQCNRLKLSDMIAKPHQRLTKYPLLLKTILKKTDEQTSRDALNNMVVCVESFINSVNSQMRQKQEKEKLATFSARVESYEAVEGASEEVEKALKEFNGIDLTTPMIDTSPEAIRQLHLEGALRMKEGKDGRMDVYCFLFTDLLLITKPVKRLEKVKVIRQPLLLQNVVCRELKDTGSFVLIYLNEFKNAVAAYSFQANSATQGKSWTDSICNVQNQLQRLRSEEARRQKACLKKRLVENQEEDEDSCNSIPSSPQFIHKNQSNSQSDGSAETLSVMDMDESGSSLDPSTLQSDLAGHSDHDARVSQLSDPAVPQRDFEPHPDSQEGSDLDPQCCSSSIDSAYGTLSPETMLETQSQVALGEEDDSEDDKETTGDEGEDEEHENAEDEDDEEDKSSFGSQNSVTKNENSVSVKPRCRPPILCRLPFLERLTVKSCSEDNLLSAVHHCNSNHSVTRAATECTGSRVKYLEAPLSRSLTELNAAESDESLPSDPETDESFSLTWSLPSSMLMDTLRRARIAHEAGSNQIPCSASDGELSPPCRLERKGRCKRPQQHRKLTLAQLHRIQTTLVLNSTLTASEV
ncbi:pleckstrin homology domain-containing family G member 5-like isoform X2 [Carassius carassius]|uniref:pleckstrin homology domain-containing family G member 5-like isoform X2 n=1 Tax=Carassius carassius TaxID=217509 RepID=UPI002869573E|nr:pleckstrin homology domain-containing family G member 5-like isoform X2 [Carassius carassius]XP_059397321.1 pleckstrin homology domain-containing family G member 5-like isoform X2 [Carassius carassius]XP_059397322.1 pleckstrin homology domain-containing family G member 5-like isoform X2 [Carassius carassius]